MDVCLCPLTKRPLAARLEPQPLVPRFESKAGHPLNGLPQIIAEWTPRGDRGIYVGADFSQRNAMQNQQNAPDRRQLGRFFLPIASVAKPATILMAVGLGGLFVDLFVQPISPIGLSLILLAAAPWLLQIWSLRLQPVAPGAPCTRAQPETGMQVSPRRPCPEPRSGSSGQNAGASKTGEPSPPARANPRRIQPLEPATRQLPLAEADSTAEHRPAKLGSSPSRPHPARTA